MTSTTPLSPAAEVQTLLRFLSQDARLPLSTALSKINDLRTANLNTPEAISKSNAAALTPIFAGDEKIAKQVLAAAKRVSNPKNSKKRSAPHHDDVGSPKRTRHNGSGPGDSRQSSAELEASLALPVSTLAISELQSMTLQTNRAPLLLAFAVTLLKYTMPEQPVSSRLSLAQAVVSANSRTKAQSIGLVEGKSAEDEGWGKGQPRVRVMGRLIAVMRRYGYGLDAGASLDGAKGRDSGGDDVVKREGEKEEAGQATIQAEDDYGVASPKVPQQESQQLQAQSQELPLWGLDLEALRNSNTGGPQVTHPISTRYTTSSHPGLPIHTPQSARSYLLKSFTLLPDQAQYPSPTTTSIKNDPLTPPTRHAALSNLLQALDILISSWAPPNLPHNTTTTTTTTTTTIQRTPQDIEALDNKAWSLYIQLRPDVASGEKGWGQKGRVELAGLLRLMRKK